MLDLLRGMRSGASVHGFARPSRTGRAKRPIRPNLVSEAALAHAVADKTEAAYRRGPMFAKRAKLMTEWSRYCTSKRADIADLAEKRKAKRMTRKSNRHDMLWLFERLVRGPA